MTDADGAVTLEGRLARLVLDAGISVGGAESVTAGEVASRLASAADASMWFRGALVCYSAAVKQKFLGVPPGPVVSEACVRVMAESTRELLGCEIAYATTGVGGPDPVEGHAPGTVWLAVADTVRTVARVYHLIGEPADVVRKAVDEMLLLLADVASQSPGPTAGRGQPIRRA